MSDEERKAVEVMGHRQHVGPVREVQAYGATLLEVPALQKDGRSFEVIQYGGATIFSVRSVTEDLVEDVLDAADRHAREHGPPAPKPVGLAAWRTPMLFDLLFFLASIPGRVRRALAARREAVLTEARRVEGLRRRLADELTALSEGAALFRVSLAVPRTVAEVAGLASPWRSLLSPELRAELWPERPS